MHLYIEITNGHEDNITRGLAKVKRPGSGAMLACSSRSTSIP